MTPSPEGPVLRAVFAAADADGLETCVLRNYETLPDHVPGSDVDLLVASKHRAAVESLFHREAARHGWRLERRFQKSYRITHLRFAAAAADGGFAVLRIDLMSHVGIGPVRFVNGREILSGRRRAGAIEAPAPTMEQTINLLDTLYNAAPIKERYRAAALALAGKGPELRDCLARYLGPQLAERALAALTEEREAELGPEVRARLTRRDWHRRPLGSLLDRLDLAVEKLRRIVNPPGTLIALLGPDGIGKSTVARAIAEELANAFPGIRVRHLRPGLLPQIKQLLGGAPRKAAVASETASSTSTSPAARKQRPGTLSSLVRLFYYGIDYTLGYWLLVRPDLARGKLVLFDRYFFDYFVDRDQKAVMLPAALIRLACAFYPKPKRVFVLTASPDTVRARRADLDAAEIQRQTEGYTWLARWYPMIRVVPADGTPQSIAQAIARAVLGLDDGP